METSVSKVEKSPEFYRDLASEYLINAKYARLKEDGIRETYEEIVDRIHNMHREQYKNRVEDFSQVEKLLQEVRPLLVSKTVLPSARMMQFAGKYTMANNIRAYNCSFTHIDRMAAFSQLLLVLLCGCGVGYSVQKHHIDNLPKLKTPTITDDKNVYTIPDTIEGWADSVAILLDSYIAPKDGGENTAIIFDYSQIRAKGTYLASSQGHAPGSEPLKKAHENIVDILKKSETHNSSTDGTFKLRPIDAHDVCCALSEPVVDGGSRRAAMIAMFDNDDTEMLTCKRGAEGKDYPSWRTLANNSAVLVRHECTVDDVMRVIDGGKTITGDGADDWYHTGDPGIIFVGNRDEGANPCQPSWAKVLTPHGIRSMEQIKEGDEIWSEDGWVTVEKKWCTGVKDVYRYRTTAGVFYGTEKHRVVQNGEKIEVKDALSIDPLHGPNGYDDENEPLDPQDVMDGLVIGDGSSHKMNAGKPYLCVGKDDQCYFDSEISHLIGKQYGGETSRGWLIGTTIQPSELPYTYERRIPERFFENPTKLRGFLRGLYSANGSIASARVTLKTSSKMMCEDVQVALSSLGIASYFTTNRSKDVEFENGTYRCRQSYDVNISTDRTRFRKLIGFIHPYKTAHFDEICKTGVVRKPKSYDIVDAEYVSTEEVFDITVSGKSHTYWTTASNVSNCVEIGLYPRHPVTNESGWQFCNLCEIIAPAATVSREMFLQCCRVAAIVGTLQAGYTDFPYLGRVTEEIVRNESLLGVSMTGIFECLDRLTPDLLSDGAAVVRATNDEVAAILGIPAAARMTCVKPAGSTSWVGKTVSQGANPPPAKRYLRRFLADIDDPAFQAWQDANPHAVQRHARKPNQAYVIHRIENHEAVTIEEVLAHEHLDVIKMIRMNWVENGRVLSRCVIPTISHNVSNTVYLRKHEYKDFAQRLFDDRDVFGGVAFFEYFNARTAEKTRELQNRTALPMEPVEEDDVVWIACANSVEPNYSDPKYARKIETRNFTADSACAGGACNV